MSQCSLCGGEILDRNDARYCVYCNSTFHRSCIIEHFYRNKYCPVCNKKMSLIFMRYGLPPEPSVKKKVIPSEIRKPKWPDIQRRTEVPVFDIDLPTEPLKRTDKYIPKPRGKGGFPGLSRKAKKKFPGNLAIVAIILAVVIIGGYFGRGYLSGILPSGGTEEAPPESSSPWTVVWTYPLEGVSDIAASTYGIVLGGRTGVTVLDSSGNMLWEKEGDVSSVSMSTDIIAVINRGSVEMYDIEGSELGRYDAGTANCVSLSDFGILTTGLSDGGIVILDITGVVLQEYETGPVGSISVSPDGALTAYREGGIVYVLDILGEVKYAFEDSGLPQNRISATSSGWIFAHAGDQVFLYDGENVVWSGTAPGCEPGDMAISQGETLYAVNAESALMYSGDGQLLYTLPHGSCGGIAFMGSDIVVSDSSQVYLLRLEEPTETQAPEAGTEEPSESGEGGEAAPPSAGYQEWLNWFSTYLSQPTEPVTYNFTYTEEGEVSQEMQLEHAVESMEGTTLIEAVTMTVQTAQRKMTTSMKRWITAEGTCSKAEMYIDKKAAPLECKEFNIRGIDFRKFSSLQWEYQGEEEITVPKGTYLCHKLQVQTDSGLLTIWVYEGLPPIKITLEQGQNIVTMELT
ncbi:MAG: hypothetical protein HXS47_14260 [Theionarchaea archaeon]|nr:hypothetical protein [Theionarchaea archaeon]